MNKAILKYSWSNFEHIILCKTSKDRAIILEKSLIKFYKNRRISTRKALGHYSKDTSWLAPYRLRKGKESPMYGRKPSENTLLAHRKVILQFSLDGEFIKEFSSIKEASGEIGISKPAIVHCLKGKTKKAGGYKWKYKYE